ncbi:halocarboxylic acid dehydrogenase DehI [Tumebacillus sp. BK434]|uniref:halocarboxylic acid dehydrogenase DehI family protein n=1 Tax=Tumebacillus sp. BK434 TaxID=2512169 RepID=UPI0010CE1BFD|nr:halocarboxylic acid dehydrogenase DehI family protein [Tumebacillus sp. BK434]TCP55659.1 halocarboxylic acid dehydrogenase DehI [Tumebacillus sp. BK434]
MYIPEILEGEARGRLRKLYHNIKYTLHVPLISDVFRVLAHYPSFLTYALETSRSNLLSHHFEQLSDQLRAMPPPARPLPALPSFVTRRDLRGAAAVLPVFHYSNAKLLLLTTAWYEALSERPIPGWQQDETFIPPGIPASFPKTVPLLRIESAPPEIARLLRLITDAHYGFAPPGDIRALALYPTFLAGAWQGVESCLHTPWYRDQTDRLLHTAQSLARSLPYPLPLAPGRLQQVLSEREIASCLSIIAMYRSLLPKLILDTELMMGLLNRSAQTFWI